MELALFFLKCKVSPNQLSSKKFIWISYLLTSIEVTCYLPSIFGRSKWKIYNFLFCFCSLLYLTHYMLSPNSYFCIYHFLSSETVDKGFSTNVGFSDD